MSRKLLSIETVRTHLKRNLELAGLFGEENVRVFKEVYGLEYYSTDLQKISALVTPRLLAGKRNSFVYEDEDKINIYLLDEVVITVYKVDNSYAFTEFGEETYTKSVPDDRIMDFIHDLKQQLKTLTKTAILEELLKELKTEELNNA